MRWGRDWKRENRNWKEEGKDNAEVQRAQRVRGAEKPKTTGKSAGVTSSKEGVAPTALDEFLLLYPALTGWANFCRASGAQKRILPGENP
jgi:hypothetical protein